MLTIQPITFNNTKKYANIKSGYYAVQPDTLHFTGKIVIGKLPNEFKNINIVKLNSESKNVVDVNTIGYLAEIIKYFSPETKKTYAIKRVYPRDKAKSVTANPIEQTKTEAYIYKKVKRIKNIPKFCYYNGNLNGKGESALDNYLIMSWVDGDMASKNGAVYDFGLLSNRKIKKLFKTFSQMDEAGVIHNDLWAGNLLFTKKGVNVIDFNRSYEFNPLKNVKENNLHSFKNRFLNCYFSDCYHRKGETAYIQQYKDCLKMESDYYSQKQRYYLRNGNIEGIMHYQNLKNEIKNQFKNPKLLKQKALDTVLNSDINCFEIYAKYFEFGKTQAGFHAKKVIKLLDKHPELANPDKADLYKSNFALVENLKTVMATNKSETWVKTSRNILESISNPKIYTQEEQEKPYYKLFKRFCEFNLEYAKLKASNQDTNELISEYSDVSQIKCLKDYFSNFS